MQFLYGLPGFLARVVRLELAELVLELCHLQKDLLVCRQHLLHLGEGLVIQGQVLGLPASAALRLDVGVAVERLHVVCHERGVAKNGSLGGVHEVAEPVPAHASLRKVNANHVVQAVALASRAVDLLERLGCDLANNGGIAILLEHGLDLLHAQHLGGLEEFDVGLLEREVCGCAKHACQCDGGNNGESRSQQLGIPGT